MPPAPPNATSANRRGSWPRSSETTRIARSMLAFATRMMPSASSSTDSRSRRASDPAARPRSLDVEAHAAAEEVRRIEAAEQQVRVGDRDIACRRRSRRAPASRRHSPDRRAGRRRGRRCAIDPPPAPTVWMSMTGSRTGTSPIAVSAAVGIPPSIRLTSVEVPPASKEMTRSSPAASRDGTGADHSGGRPGQHRTNGLAASHGRRDRAAVRLHDRESDVGRASARGGRGSDRRAAARTR